MCQYLSGKFIKQTRKQHRCHGCSRIIPKGSACDYTVSVDYGELSACYICFDCKHIDHATEKDLAEYDGCIMEGAFQDLDYAKWPILEVVQKEKV